MYCSPSDSRHVITVQASLQLIGIHPLLRKGRKRKRIAYAYVEVVVHLPRKTGRRIAHRTLRIRDIRRCRHPRKPRILEQHIPTPPLHRHHHQVALEMFRAPVLTAVQPLLVDEHRELPDSKSIDIRNLVLSHERVESIPHQRPLYLVAAQRIGPVKHHHRYLFLGAAAHHQSKRGDKGIRTAAHILNIINHDIYPVKHLRGRLTRGAIERIYRQPRARVPVRLHLLPCIHIPSDTVLRGEQRHKIDFRCIKQYVNRGLQFPIHPGRVGHQTYTQTLQTTESPVPENLNSGFHLPGEHTAH